MFQMSLLYLVQSIIGEISVRLPNYIETSDTFMIHLLKFKEIFQQYKTMPHKANIDFYLYHLDNTSEEHDLE